MIAEQEKYQGIYAAPDEYPTYGSSNHGASVAHVIKRWKATSLLDVGCGWNQFCRSVKAASPEIEAVGVDFACPGADVNADATALPFADKQFDALTAFDMLEHLRPEQVDAALAEFARVSQRFIFSIAYHKSRILFQGENLHPTVRNEAWWIYRIIRAGGRLVKVSGRFIFGEWQPTLNITSSMSVIAVGNGPSVLKCQGEDIDAFDCVIRFNRYQLDGFEAHTGRRTDVWSTNAMVAAPGCSQRPEQIFQIKERNAVDYDARVNYRMPAWFQLETDAYVTARCNWMHGFPEECRSIKATSGMLLVAWLLKVVRVESVALAGFDHLGKVSQLHHYWGKPMGLPGWHHDGGAEAAIFSELKDCGKVRYLA